MVQSCSGGDVHCEGPRTRTQSGGGTVPREILL